MIKKTKLTLSGIAKKSIESIELAKTQSKNSVVIRKKTNKSSYSKPFNPRPKSNLGFTKKVLLSFIMFIVFSLLILSLFKI